jgi:hypothetical protein
MVICGNSVGYKSIYLQKMRKTTPLINCRNYLGHLSALQI